MDEGERLSVDLDQTFTGLFLQLLDDPVSISRRWFLQLIYLAVCDSCCRIVLVLKIHIRLVQAGAQAHTSRSLLLSEALHTLSRSHAGQYGLS